MDFSCWPIGCSMGQIDYYVPAGYPSLQKISRDAAFSRWWFQTVFFHYIYLGKMIQFDEHIFFKGVVQPPTIS